MTAMASVATEELFTKLRRDVDCSTIASSVVWKAATHGFVEM
jgi:hypothetical protein